MLLDLRRLLRSLRRTPGFTAVVVATLALAIGANTAIFSLIDAALLRPLPLPEPDRLVAVWEQTNLFGLRYSPPAFANYADWRTANRSFEEMGLHEHGAMLLTGAGAPEELASGAVTASLFRALRVQPVLGRLWSEGEDQPGAAKTTILSHGLWQRRFAADPAIVGRVIQLGGTPYTVIGVLPAGFAVPGQNESLWLPFGCLYDQGALHNRSRHNFFVAGRLRPGISLAQANADLAAVSARLQQEYPDTNTNLGAFAAPITEHLTGKVRPLYLVLVAAVGLVLFTACANLANLLLARAVGRRHETAVRVALGADRHHLLRYSLLEAGALGLLGGVAGVFVALWSLDLLVPLAPAGLTACTPPSLDWRALLFSLAATLVTILLVGLAPLWQLARASALDALRQDGVRSGTGVHTGRLRAGLVVAQLALSLCLLIGAGLLLRTFSQLRATDLGFRRDHVAVARLSGNAMWRHYGRDQTARATFYREVVARVSALPGVEAAAFANGVPLLTKGNMALIVPERPLATARPDDALTVNRRVVTPAYFTALGAPLLRGRALAATDTADQPPVAVVNVAMARKLWPDLADPVGQRLRNGDAPWATVVGVVGDMRQKGVDQAAAPEVYFSTDQIGEPAMMLVVRTSVEPQTVVSLLRRELAAVNADLPIVQVSTLDTVVGRELAPRRLQTILLAAFAGLALLVALLGLYGVVAFAVASRTREFGIRAAFGATRQALVRLVLADNLRLLLPGLGLGLVGALSLARLMAGLLYGVVPYDPLTFLGATLLLALGALVACWLPTRRATRVDPMVALRAE